MVDRQTVRELLESRGPKLQQHMGQGWKLHYALFVREGLTAGATQKAAEQKALVVTMHQMDADFQRVARL